MSPSAYDAVVLAGGRARRMQGVDKTVLPVGGRALLDRVVGSVGGAGRVIVVGEPRPVPVDVVWAREEPPGGGPAAGLAAGLVHVTAPVVVVLAADLPFVTAAVVGRLVQAVGATGAPGAVLVDDTGHEQWLCSAWATAALRVAPLAAGAPARRALGALPFVAVPDRTGGPPPWLDCDTPADLQRARENA